MSNIKWIWWVAGLMIIAIAGIVWMQISWIRENIRVVEDQFDTEVFSALNSVKQEIEEGLYNYDLREDGTVFLGPVRVSDSISTRWTDLFSNTQLDEIRNSRVDLEKLRSM